MKELFFLILFSLMASPVFGDKKNVDPLCEGLTGNAAGLCNSATSPGNDCPNNPDKNSCVKLAENYEKETGEAPPWLPVPE